MKILIDQRDGLGNQLFQYAAGLYFARKYNATIEIIPELEQRASSFGHPRPFLISKFSITAPFRTRTAWDRLMCSVAAYKRPLAESARRLSRTQFFKQHHTAYNQFLPDLTIAPSTEKLYINGNFQAYQYADNVEQQLRTEFSLRESMSGESLEILQKIRSSISPVSLHVRRGDYAVYGGGKSVLPMSYYRNAIQVIQEQVASPTYFIFSDDIAFARENLPPFERAIFVGHNAEDAAHEDLQLMASCRHHIIANSTFSWWGAWLNPSPEKQVIIPDRWFNLNPVPHNMVHPKWNCIPVYE